MQCVITAVTSPVGQRLAGALLSAGYQVLGTADAGGYAEHANNMALLLQHPLFQYHELDLCSRTAVMALFAGQQVDIVVHLGGRSGLCFLDKNNQHCVDASQRMMLNLLDAALGAQCRHFVYSQAVALYSECSRGRARHQMTLSQVEYRQQLLAHTYSVWHRLYTSGLALSIEGRQHEANYYGRERMPLAQQLLQMVQTGPQLASQANPYFALYQAAGQTASKWGRRNKSGATPQQRQHRQDFKDAKRPTK